MSSRFRLELGTPEMEDHLHDVYIIVLTAIRNGMLRDACRFSGYFHNVGARERAAKIKEIVWNRHHLASNDE